MHWRAEKPLGQHIPVHTYHLYGLCLKSQWPLPCPQRSASGVAEVELFEGPASLFFEASQAIVPSDRAGWFHHVLQQNGSHYLRWSGLFEFVIAADGRWIAAHRHIETNQEAFYTYLLGQALSFVLLKHGIEPLHATAVVIDGAAVGFLGDGTFGAQAIYSVGIEPYSVAIGDLNGDSVPDLVTVNAFSEDVSVLLGF